MPSLVGGGAKARPGEISLAHNGVLFLDELPEFTRSSLEALRQPIESGRAVVSRANAKAVYPARFQLVAAMNPCRCGYLDDAARACSRAPKCAADYQAKISGPLFDRIDLHVDVPAVAAADLTLPPPSDNSAAMATRVAAARRIQGARYRAHSVRTNAQADGELLQEIAAPDAEGQSLLTQAADAMGLFGAWLSPRTARRADPRRYGQWQCRRPGPYCRGAHLSPGRVGALSAGQSQPVSGLQSAATKRLLELVEHRQ